MTNPSRLPIDAVALVSNVHRFDRKANCSSGEGGYATLRKIERPEGHIACHLRLIAVQLYKASKVIAPNVSPPDVRASLDILTDNIEALLGT